MTLLAAQAAHRIFGWGEHEGIAELLKRIEAAGVALGLVDDASEPEAGCAAPTLAGRIPVRHRCGT